MPHNAQRRPSERTEVEAKSDDAARIDEQAGQLVIDIPEALENHQPCEIGFVLLEGDVLVFCPGKGNGLGP